ncbi:hypothetical protein GCK72_007195 [Caenorhabditis remanei]|uniref:Uncharacterized protein n=1 Tax=Caenorhabditis remanei TaxID=31234 RepID=A0A6A5HKM4_CAERE|nr:hypothetical protein GCK72_007195 [Caenorhabditis remanei]KAF1767236.1 hypothetical protein GCK72_007195 [Caenorhabditis remanei]
MPDDLQYVTNTITMINDFIGIHARFETKIIMDRMLALSGFGSLVKDIISMAKPNQPDPVLLKLEVLDRKIGELSRKMSYLFDDLKSFMVAHNFYKKFACTASTLMKLMQDTISNPCGHSKGIFKNECERTPPLRWALDFISQLENESTNPLKMAMKADPLKTRQTFNKWRDIIDGVLAQFLFLETYLNGMFWDSNMYGPNNLKGRIENLKNDMNQWYEDYHDQNEGWNGVRKLVEDTQDDCEHMNNAQKANKLQVDLDNILSNNAFYVLVYNDCGGYGNHAFCHEDDNFICSFRRGKCNVVVYRTFRFHNRGHHAGKLRNVIESRPPYPTLDSYENFIDTLRSEAGKKGECGFVGMIRANNNVAVKWVNCDPNDVPNGPGAFTYVQTSDRYIYYGTLGGRMIRGDKFFVIAGIR